MARTKRKDRPSLEIIESDEEDNGSPLLQRGKERDCDILQGRRTGNANGEGFDTEGAHARHVRPGPPTKW
jgi:hypothetical protein